MCVFSYLKILVKVIVFFNDGSNLMIDSYGYISHTVMAALVSKIYVKQIIIV